MRTRIFLFLVILAMTGCSNTNVSSKVETTSEKAVATSEPTTEDAAGASEEIALNHEIERVRVKLEDYIVGKDEMCWCLCLKQNDEYYALSRIEPGRREKKFGIAMYTEDFMYDESRKTFSSRHPRELVLLAEDRVILGDVPIPIVSKEDVLLSIYSQDHDSFDPSSVLRAYKCQFDGYTLRMTKAPVYEGWLVYDFINDETVYLGPEEFETAELKDEHGRRHNKQYDTMRKFIGFESLEYGESYQMTWEKEGEKMQLEVVADSYRYSYPDFMPEEYNLELIGKKYNPFYYEEYRVGDLPPGLYYIPGLRSTSSGFIEVR